MNLTEIKRFFIGEPFPTSHDAHERLDKVRALAVFASDPISSNAYATEAIMSVLVVLGSGALHLTLPVGLCVMGLVLLVVFSYIQTILHYPQGGGAYMVSKDNLGTAASLFAASALLIDYVLTVSVSISAGVRAVTSAFPEVFEYRVTIALVAIVLITWVNLRGIRESGTFFAIPTYAFIAGVLLVVAIGLVRWSGIFGAPYLPVVAETVEAQTSATGFLFFWIILRAFAGGCTALTGIEAISDGVQAFKFPESKNAAKTMVAMGVIAMTLFIGITFLASQIGLVPQEADSILSQLTRRVTGGGFIYYWVQVFTALILFMAANTGFQDFPRLSYFMARDGYMPRWFASRGDRLVYSSGILVLAVVASGLIFIFQADEIRMLPLYAIGVMLCFSLSQAGMFRLMGRIAHLKPGEILETNVTTVHYERGVNWKRAVNALGSVVTFVVFLTLLITKFTEGAWIVALIIPLLLFTFYSIHGHYRRVADSLSIQNLKEEQFSGVANVVIIPIADIHRGSLLALQYARRLSSDVRAVSILPSEAARNRLLERWNKFPGIIQDINLIMVHYDYRDILTPLIDYIKHVNDEEFPDKLTTVVIPEILPDPPAARILHNQAAARLRWTLRQYRNIVIIEVPFHIDSQL